MRLFALILLLLAFASSPTLAVGGPEPSKFIVHEWGTFTSFAGSDGISLEFRPLQTSDLPAFVFDRAKQARLFDQRFAAGDRSGYTSKAVLPTRQRMETPVTYFYSDTERTVDVTVGFPQGLLTEFYPPVRMMMPVFNPRQADQLGKSLLIWEKVKIIPAAKVSAKMLPPTVSGDDHYGFARDTDSAMLQLDDKLLNKTHYEKFLFYRGIGNFDLPMSMTASADGKFLIRNAGRDPISAAFLVEIKNGRIRCATLGKITAQQQAALPEAEMTIDDLANAMVKAIVAEGMYEKEAQSMVNTWRSSWFGDDGTRLLYLLPGALTDRMIPLTVKPAPDQVLRVMVGRLEILTPQVERNIEDLLIKLASPTPAERDQAMAAITRFGRFAEPALQRVSKLSDSPEIKARARELLAKLQK
jgi:hypothetical protein